MLQRQFALALLDKLIYFAGDEFFPRFNTLKQWPGSALTALTALLAASEDLGTPVLCPVLCCSFA